jgi:hypothetical protein
VSELTYEVERGEALEECGHKCSFACGNNYAFVVVTVADSTTQFLCVPCYVQTAMAMVQAITDPDSPVVRDAVAEYEASRPDTVGTRGRNKSLIAGIDTGTDAGVFDEFEPDITSV